MHRFTGLAALTSACIFGAPASAGMMVNFDQDDGGNVLGNGQIMDQGAGEFGVLFDLIHGGGGAGLGIFDTTTGVNSADPDLWVDQGNALIVQNAGSTSTGNFWDTPNDDANGGTIIFAFHQATLLESIMLIDINGGGHTMLTLADSIGNERIYDVPDDWTGDITEGAPGLGTLFLNTLVDQPGHLSIATATQDVGFDPNDVRRLTVTFDGSGALDNLALPGPSGLAVMLVGFAAARRRRR